MKKFNKVDLTEELLTNLNEESKVFAVSTSQSTSSEERYVDGKKVFDKRTAESDVESTEPEVEKKLTRSLYRSLVLRYGRRLKEYKVGLQIAVEYPDERYSYKLKRPIGQWPEYPMFTPDLTPPEILSLGVYKGWLFRDCFVEFPREWFILALQAEKIAFFKPLKKYNFYKVDENPVVLNYKSELVDEGLTQSLRELDPRGWTQWYFRFYLGRRIPELDRKQILRWIYVKKKFLELIKASCKQNDFSCKPRTKQALLCWGIDPEKRED